jgi:hypothetical protein
LGNHAALIIKHGARHLDVADPNDAGESCLGHFGLNIGPSRSGGFARPFTALLWRHSAR